MHWKTDGLILTASPDRREVFHADFGEHDDRRICHQGGDRPVDRGGGISGAVHARRGSHIEHRNRDRDVSISLRARATGSAEGLAQCNSILRREEGSDPDRVVREIGNPGRLRWHGKQEAKPSEITIQPRYVRDLNYGNRGHYFGTPSPSRFRRLGMKASEGDRAWMGNIRGLRVMLLVPKAVAPSEPFG